MTEPQISDEVFGAAAFAARRATASLLTIDQTLDVAHAVLAAAVPLLYKQWEAERGEPTVEYSIVRDRDGHRYGGYNSECRAPGCDCYLASEPEAIVGDDHVERREVYRTPWRRLARAVQPGGQQ